MDLRYNVEISFRVGIPREDDAINPPDMAMFKVLASHFGLERTGYGRAFRSKDEIFRIVAINPINAERSADGRGFNFLTSNVTMRLSSVHALSSTLYKIVHVHTSTSRKFRMWRFRPVLAQGEK